jgi:hypothetical protein
MLFSKELMNLIIEHTRKHGYNPNIAFIPFHHGGEMGGTLEKKNNVYSSPTS